METNCFDSLHRDLSQDLCIVNPNLPYLFPNVYRKRLINSFHSFIGECRQNITSNSPKEEISMIISNLLFKLKQAKTQQFKNEENQIIHRYSDQIIENIENKEVAKNIKLQFEFYDAAISYLQDECLAKFEFEPKKIGKTAATVRPRKKSSEYQGFKTNLNAKQIEEIFRDLIFYKFIPSNSDLKNFICIFQGGYPTEKITWLGCNFELRYFIQKIYPKITKNPPKQIWEVTINCFCNEEGESYDKKQLRFNTEKPNSTNEIILVVDNILNEYSGS